MKICCTFLSVIINCEDTNFGLPLGADIGDVTFDELLGEVGLPSGNLTSQMFANLYLNELDQFCNTNCTCIITYAIWTTLLFYTQTKSIWKR